MERTGITVKCTVKNGKSRKKESRKKRAKLLFFNVSYGTFVMLLLLSSWWFLKLPVFFICNCSGSRCILLESYLHHIRAHNQLTHNQLKQAAPSWPDSSTSEGLHRNRKGQGSNPRSGLNFSGNTCYCLSSAKNCEDN